MRRQNRAGGAACGLLAARRLGLAAAIVGVILFSRATGLPRLTRQAYENASRLWDAHQPAHYNLDVEVTGNRPSRIHVEVRDGQAIHCIRDGVEPSQRRTWYYWTVPGMLDTIGQELDKIDDPATGFGAAAGSSVVLRGRVRPAAGISTPLLAQHRRAEPGHGLDHHPFRNRGGGKLGGKRRRQKGQQ